MAKYTKLNHEMYLNNIHIEDENQWIIGGKLRRRYMYANEYGTALRKFDPLAFRVSYYDRQREIINNNRLKLAK